MIGCGFVVHDEVGNIIAARIEGLQGPMTALDAESLSCRADLQWLFWKIFGGREGKKGKIKSWWQGLEPGKWEIFCYINKAVQLLFKLGELLLH